MFKTKSPVLVAGRVQMSAVEHVGSYGGASFDRAILPKDRSHRVLVQRRCKQAEVGSVIDDGVPSGNLCLFCLWWCPGKSYPRWKRDISKFLVPVLAKSHFDK